MDAIYPSLAAGVRDSPLKCAKSLDENLGRVQTEAILVNLYRTTYLMKFLLR